MKFIKTFYSSHLTLNLFFSLFIINNAFAVNELINLRSGNHNEFFRANGSDVLLCPDDEGKVGIGTTSPSAPLSVCGHNVDINLSTEPGVHIGNYSSDGSTKYGMIEMIANTTAGPWIDFKVSTTSSLDKDGRIRYGESTGDLNGFGFWTNDTHRMCITTGGNVGIGLNNPGGILEMKPHADSCIRFVDNDYNGTNRPGIVFGRNHFRPIQKNISKLSKKS